MSHPRWNLTTALIVIAVTALAAGSVWAAEITPGYGGSGVWPQAASANSERYFRFILEYDPGDEFPTSFTLTNVRMYDDTFSSLDWLSIPGGAFTSDDPVGRWQVYTISSSSDSREIALTLGPFAARNLVLPGNPLPDGVVGEVFHTPHDDPREFEATLRWTSDGDPDSAEVVGTYRTAGNNDDYLQWYTGDAEGEDPLSVDTATVDPDDGSGSSRYRFKVMYHTTHYNLPPRTERHEYPPGPEYSRSVWHRASDTFVERGDWHYDDWTYDQDEDPHTVDTIGWEGDWDQLDPTVALIIDGDRTRPRFMHPMDAGDTDYQNGAVFYYDILPTDYKRYLDNVFLFPYDPAGPDPRDRSFLQIRGRSLSNNYVSLKAGGHTYEFLATDDFSPANDDNAWLQVGRPGNGLYNQFMRTYHSSLMVSGVDLDPPDPSGDPVYTRWLDGDGVGGGAGYPYDSQNPDKFPNVNPVLTAHPFFTHGHIPPGEAGGDFGPNPAGVEPNPFQPETGFGPVDPERFTNDDTILPNYVNIQPETAGTPFIGGRWTNQERYTFRINYWQSDNVAPSVMKVFIRKVSPTEQGTWSGGSWQGFTMEQRDPSDSDYTDGCVFQFQATPQQLPGGGGPGDYNYYFQASDGSRTTIFPNRPGDYDVPGGGTIRDPGTYGVPASSEGEDYYWFRVNTPPTLSDAGVDPVAGNTGSNFRYSVTYTDADGGVLDAAANGDRPFRGKIHVDLFGNPQGNAEVSAVVNAQTLEYDTPNGDGYDANALAGMQIRVLSGTAADQTFPITGNSDTEITTSGDFQTAGVTAGDTFRIEDWFTAEMAQANASDQDYSGGVVFEFNTATNVELGPGTHRYYFEFVDDWASWLFPNDQNVKVLGETVRHPESGFIQGPEVQANSGPVLSDFRFTPKSTTAGEDDGTTATSFVFFVTYTDLDNDPPAFIRLALDGTPQSPDRVLELTPDPPSDTVYTDGVAYKSDPVKLAAGDHQFYGQASDGDARYPDADPGDPLIYVGPEMPQNPDPSDPPDDPPDANNDGYQDYVVGPTVAENTPPTLSFPADDDGSDPDNPPGLDPNTGDETTGFTYTVIYTDTDRFAGQAGNPPKFVRVFIDGQQYDMTSADPQDTDYTNGATYTLEGVTLAEGTPHTYFFLGSDDMDTARLPELGQVADDRYRGPVVDEPPAEPLNLLAQDRPNDNGGVINLEFSASADDGGGARDVTEYRLYRTENEGEYNDPPVLTIPATQSASYMVQDDTAVTDQPYFYVVRAFDGVAESANSNEEGPVTAIDNIKPQPPSNVQVTDPGLGGTLQVEWNLSPDDGGGQNDVTEYHIYRSTDSTAYTPPPVGTVPAGETQFVDSTVPHGTGNSFYYTVRAFDGSNESDNAPESQAQQPTDAQPPEVVDVQPQDGARDVDLQPTISFAVEDTGAGVDINAVSLFINGNPVPFDDLTVDGAPDRYEISYTPDAAFDYQQNVRVRVTAEDIDGNAGEANWSFLTRGRPTASVSGTVTEPDGTGVANVTVTAGEISATTNGQGEYTIGGLADGTYQVVAELRGWHITPPQIAVTVPPDASGISFTAQPGFDITGTVVDEDGQPMQGVQVAAGDKSDITDDQGNYALIDLPAGTYQVVPSLEGFEFDPTLRNVEIGPGSSGAGTDFTASVETHSLSGRVETSSGERMENVNVTAENLDTGETTVEATGISGQYTFSDLPRGRYTVTPTTSGYQFKPTSQEVELFAPKSDVNFVGVPLYGVQLPQGLSFVSVPIDPETTDFTAAFGANSSVARWDGVNARWITDQTPTNPILDLAPGRGYFVRTQQAGTSFVPGTPISTDVGFNLNLTVNWNTVGNPYPTPLAWSQIGVAPGGTVRDYGFIYDQGIDDYRLVADVTGYGILDTIPQGAGFWMHTDAARSVRITAPASTAAAGEPAMSFGDGDYLIPVQAVSAGSSDGCAAAGVAAEADAMPGGGQIINPPAKGAGVDLYFVGDDGRKLSYDVRPAGSSSHSWEFEVATTADAPVTVALPDLSAVPADQQVTLVDTVTEKRVYARTMRGYSYEANADQPRRFRLEVADRTAAALVVSSATAQSEDGRVTLSYSLSQPASVSVNVMNISGRLIRTVAAGQARTAGVNTETWDLRNARGAMVPSGKYLMCVRATADNGQQVQSVVPVQVMR